ncbi:MAG: XdhC family protein [Streptosporangiaceae bacterium]
MDNSWGVLEQAGELARNGEPFALATVVWRQGPSSSQQGSRAVITAGGELSGWIGGACAEPAVIREAQRVIKTGTAKLLLLGSPEQFGGSVPEGMTVVPIACQSEGALEVYIEPVLPAPHLVVIGRSPMAQTLVSLALTLGWRAVLIDGPDFTAADATPASMAVVATQGHDDETVIERVVAARPAYLGLVGSHRRGAAVLGYLADRGIPKDQLDRVHVPAGLDLGSITHAEIAVAILAELVQLRAAGAIPATPATGEPAGQAAGTRRGPGAKASAARPSEAGARPAGPGAAAGEPGPEATDPVCGMQVLVTSRTVSADLDGSAYYFCGAGCRQAFVQDPAAYLKKDTRC